MIDWTQSFVAVFARTLGCVQATGRFKYGVFGRVEPFDVCFNEARTIYRKRSESPLPDHYFRLHSL